MSSRKATSAKAPRPATGAKPKAVSPAKSASANAEPAEQNGVSAEAIRLAAEIERAFAKDENALSKEAMQALMGALCRVYAAQVESGARYTPIEEGQVVSPTGVMLTASGLLRAANLAVFELGMWQSWTGR
jgi:hypothetical protein